MTDNRNFAEYCFNDIKVGETKLLFCGNQQCPPGHSYGPYVRPHDLLVYVKSGKGIFRSRSASYMLSAGSTFCVFPGEVAYYQADLSDPWEYFWIAFHEKSGPRGMEHFLQQASVSPSRPIHITDQPDRLCALYAEIFQLCRAASGYGELKIMSVFLDIMYHYVISTNRYEKSRFVLPAVSCDHIDRALDYIRTHYQENISVSTAARSWNLQRISVRSFSKASSYAAGPFYPGIPHKKLRHAVDFHGLSDPADRVYVRLSRL